MPGLDGIEVGKRFRRKNGRCKIVMGACREDRVLDAFHLEACRFPSETAEEAGRLGGAECLCKKSRGAGVPSRCGKCASGEVSQRDIVFAKLTTAIRNILWGDHLMRSERSLLELGRSWTRLFFPHKQEVYCKFSPILKAMTTESCQFGKKKMKVSRRKKGGLSSYQEFDLYFR